MANACVCYEISDDTELKFNIRTFKGETWEFVIDHVGLKGQEKFRVKIRRRGHNADIELRVGDRAVMDINAVERILGKHYTDMAQHTEDVRRLFDLVSCGTPLPEGTEDR